VEVKGLEPSASTLRT